MQDIIPIKPERKSVKRKSNKVLVILSVIAGILIIVAGTYFVTKKYFAGTEKEEVKTEERTVDEEPKEDGEYLYVTSKAGLNLRAGDSTEDVIIYTLPYREKIKIEEKNKDESWYKTTFSGVTGWFSKEYTAKNEPDDETTDWQEVTKETPAYLALKYPSAWKEKTPDRATLLFNIAPTTGGFEQIYIEQIENVPEEVAKTLVDANHNIAANSVFAMAGLKGRKYVVQTIKDGKVMYTEDVILIEKDKKTLKIVGPADGETSGDIFNLFVWTIKLDKGTSNEEV